MYSIHIIRLYPFFHHLCEHTSKLQTLPFRNYFIQGLLCHAENIASHPSSISAVLVSAIDLDIFFCAINFSFRVFACIPSPSHQIANCPQSKGDTKNKHRPRYTTIAAPHPFRLGKRNRGGERGGVCVCVCALTKCFTFLTTSSADKIILKGVSGSPLAMLVSTFFRRST